MFKGRRRDRLDTKARYRRQMILKLEIECPRLCRAETACVQLKSSGWRAGIGEGRVGVTLAVI